jgi:SAM-dependent methyltransferase
MEAPVNVCIQWSTRDEALRCPKGNIELVFCRACGFIWNVLFDPTRLDYTQTYENSLFYSPLFQEYTNNIVWRLINRYKLQNKDIIDIGCGKGDFLFLLCKLGNNRGVGFDTSYEGNGDGNKVPDGVTIIQDFYSEKYAEYKGDLICSRFVLEHIEHPKAFLRMLRKTIGDSQHVIVFFEVPNTSLILRDLSVWDIIYEHCSYFTFSSLERVFTLSGFDVLDLYESYKGQFLGIEALPSDGQGRPGKRSEDNLQEIAKEVDSFVDNIHKQRESWQKNLEGLRITGKKMVLWGAGARGVSFLNMLRVENQVQYVVDINPQKHGKYIAGTGQQIVPPEFLRTYKPNILILTNAIYKNEIQKTVKSLGINSEFI